MYQLIRTRIQLLIDENCKGREREEQLQMLYVIPKKSHGITRFYIQPDIITYDIVLRIQKSKDCSKKGSHPAFTGNIDPMTTYSEAS